MAHAFQEIMLGLLIIAALDYIHLRLTGKSRD
jgi:hypothetical protein